MRRVLSIALPVIGILLFLALWWFVTSVSAPPGSLLSRFAPDKAWTALNSLLVGGRIWPHFVASVRRVLVGLAISASIGIPLGLLIGSFRWLNQLTGPVFQFIRMVSPLAWTPLAIILLGVGDAPVYFLIAIGCIWPIVLNTSAGVHALNPQWLTVGRSLGASRAELLTTIIWPGIRAHVLTGVRLSVGLAWIILVPAEMLGVDTGLGYFILDTRDRFAYGELAAAILIIGVLGFLLDAITRWVFQERRRRTARPQLGTPESVPAA